MVPVFRQNGFGLFISFLSERTSSEFVERPNCASPFHFRLRPPSARRVGAAGSTATLSKRALCLRYGLLAMILVSSHQQGI